MLPLDPEAFKRELEQNFTEHKADNAWFTSYPQNLDKYTTDSCYSAYTKSYSVLTETLLLGDTKLRSDHELVQNFGLSSANGVQEESARPVIDQAQAMRDRVAMGVPAPPAGASASAPSLPRAPSLPTMPMAGSSAAAGAGSAAPSSGAIPVVGAGSILSTTGWSPMLNDSFIMGGVHGLHSFKLALVGDDLATFNSISSAGGPKERWRQYFELNKDSYWCTRHNVPRVFTREVIGLSAFGYKPTLAMGEITFDYGTEAKAKGATLTKYRTELNTARVTGNKDETAVKARFLAYLFSESKEHP